MNLTHDLYGRRTGYLDEARTSLGSATGVQFEERDSEYHGGKFFRARYPSGENWLLKYNFDPIDNLPAETTFPDHVLLLYVNSTLRTEQLQQLIERSDAMFKLLRRDFG
jgi:hypothetical protein